MSEWRPMTEHVFPWGHKYIIVAAYYRQIKNDVDILRCLVAEHGAIFERGGGMLSIHEQEWTPFAWRVDDTPIADDSSFPPLLYDYLTNPDNAA